MIFTLILLLFNAFIDFNLNNFGGSTHNVIGDVNNDGKRENVEIVSVFNKNNAETDYYFNFNSREIPMLPTTGCAKINDVYDVGDIDEDGANEIAIYFSSCASRYKHIAVFTLKNQRWHEVGRANYDIGFPEPSIKERIKKTGKGTFKIREIVSSGGGAPITDKELFFEISR